MHLNAREARYSFELEQLMIEEDIHGLISLEPEEQEFIRQLASTRADLFLYLEARNPNNAWQVQAWGLYKELVNPYERLHKWLVEDDEHCQRSNPDHPFI